MSNTVTIYHNPRCSKSRQTLELIKQKGIEPEVVLYLDKPPTSLEISTLLKKLDIRARDLLRTKEEPYKTLGLSDTSLSDTQLIEAMTNYPKLIERPIVVKGSRAVLGRPPENVYELL